MSKVQCVHDDNSNVKSQGVSFLHCKKCLVEKPDGVSPAEWAKLNVSITATGDLQVWCVRHQINVDLMTFRCKESK